MEKGKINMEKVKLSFTKMISTPLKSVRKYCLWCMNGQVKEIRLCPKENCIFYKFRMGRGKVKLKHIRLRCLDCSGGATPRVQSCEFNGTDDELCILFPYRMGRRPK